MGHQVAQPGSSWNIPAVQCSGHREGWSHPPSMLVFSSNITAKLQEIEGNPYSMKPSRVSQAPLPLPMQTVCGVDVQRNVYFYWLLLQHTYGIELCESQPKQDMSFRFGIVWDCIFSYGTQHNAVKLQLLRNTLRMS